MPVNAKIANENWERYILARDGGHTDYVKKAEKCDNYFAGLQWDELVRQKLERQGKPVLTINETFATMMAIMGNQIQHRADITFAPSRDGNEATAKALMKTYLQIANDNKLDWLESEVAADGFITSRGFVDVRVGFDDHLKGEVKLDILNPKNCLIDPDADHYDPATWKEVFISKWLTPDDIATLHNPEDAKLLEMRPGDEFNFGHDSVDIRKDSFGNAHANNNNHDDHHERRTIRVIERQFKKNRMRRFFVNATTGDMRPVPENWDPDRVEFVKRQYGLDIFQRLAEQIRWTVTADNVVLHDEWSPYKFFTPVPYFPVFRRGRTIGLVENLISPQDVLNKASSQELHVVNTTANSGWIIKNNSLKNMDPQELEQRGAETGLVLEVEDVSDVKKISPNTIPTGLDRISSKAKEHMEAISNVSESQRGLDRADVAAKAIQAKQAAGTANLAKPFDNLSRTRHLVAERVLSLVQTYYTEERVLQVTGKSLSAGNEDITVNQTTPEGDVVNDLTAGEYSVTVTTVPAHDTTRESQFMEAIRLRELGVAIPDDVLVENSTLDRKAEIAQAIKELNGGAEPSETQQQLAELEVQAKQLENSEKEADIARKQSETRLADARASKTQADAQDTATGDSGAQAALEKVEVDRQVALTKIQGELQLKRDSMEAELEIKRDQARQENLLKRAEAEERLAQQPTESKGE